MATIGTCKLCEKQAKLVRAHIIPNSFYKPILEETGHAILVTNKTDRDNRVVSTGVYDEELVCEPCERSFSPYDTYARSFLLDNDWSQFYRADIEAYVVPTFDYVNTKLFFMSVLWRMAASIRQEFASVTLDGPPLERLRQDVLNRDPGIADGWSVFIGRFDGRHPKLPEFDPRCGWLNPQMATLGDRRCVKMYLCEFTVYVKVESQSLKPFWRDFCLQPDRPLCVIPRDFGSSRELALMWKMSRRKATTKT